MIFVRSDSGAHTGVFIPQRYKYPSKEETSRKMAVRYFYERLKKIDTEIRELEREKENCLKAIDYLTKK